MLLLSIAHNITSAIHIARARASIIDYNKYDINLVHRSKLNGLHPLLLSFFIYITH